MIYTCPMHPEIEQDHAGHCPKCGMTLEPKTIGAGDEEEQKEIRSLSRKFWSAVAVLAPGIFPESFRSNGEVGLYFEAAAVITTLVLFGQSIEAKARSRTGQAIKALLNLAAKTAHRVRDGQEDEIAVEQIQ